MPAVFRPLKKSKVSEKIKCINVSSQLWFSKLSAIFSALCFVLLCLSNPVHATTTLEWDFSQASDYTVAGTATVSGNLAHGTVTSAINPQEIGAWGSPNIAVSVFDVIIRGQYAYLATGLGGLQIIDISTPTSPSLIGTYNTTNAVGVTLSSDGNTAYVADFWDGLRIIGY